MARLSQHAHVHGHNQGSNVLLRGLWGHLLHTVTLLVLYFFSFSRCFHTPTQRLMAVKVTDFYILIQWENLLKIIRVLFSLQSRNHFLAILYESTECCCCHFHFGVGVGVML